MKNLGIAVAGVLGLAAVSGAGYLSASLPDLPAVSSAKKSLQIGAVLHQGPEIRSLLPVLAAKIPKLEEEQATGGPVEPVELPVDFLLQSRLKAVLGQGRRSTLLVASPDGAGETLRLKKGDPFENGWVIESIEPQTVALERNGETVIVQLFGVVPDASGQIVSDNLTQEE